MKTTSKLLTQRVENLLFCWVLLTCIGRNLSKGCAVLCLVAQLCLTLCNRKDYSLPGSSVHGILQARILEWVAFTFSRGSSQPRDRTQVSHTGGRFFTTWATREAQERVLEWVAYPFSRGSSRPRDRTQVSHTGGRRFKLWATREVFSFWSFLVVNLFILFMGFSLEETLWPT